MRAVVTRVLRAAVEVGDQQVGAIDRPGLLVLLEGLVRRSRIFKSSLSVGSGVVCLRRETGRAGEVVEGVAVGEGGCSQRSRKRGVQLGQAGG